MTVAAICIQFYQNVIIIIVIISVSADSLTHYTQQNNRSVTEREHLSYCSHLCGHTKFTNEIYLRIIASTCLPLTDSQNLF